MQSTDDDMHCDFDNLLYHHSAPSAFCSDNARLRLWVVFLSFFECTTSRNSEKTKFTVDIGEGQIDEMLTYNLLSKIVLKQQDLDEEDPDNKAWTFVSFEDHNGPLLSNNPV
jgi:hypothetical protein